MTKADTVLANSGPGSRLRRLPFVLMLTLGLLLSLIHCAGCGTAFAATDSVSVMAADHGAASPDLPDQQLPAHSGHCLSHVAPQACSAVAMPAVANLSAPKAGDAPFPRALTLLPLFKPPRA